MYVTDGERLLYVLELYENGRALVEDVRTNEVVSIVTGSIDGWRLVEPARAA
jgi:hypothetical protein